MSGITAIVGFAGSDGDIRNAAAVLHDGKIAGVYHKIYLPNYGVFDEERYFRSGDELVLLRLGDALVGLSICEDIWYPGAPSENLALAGAQLIVNISASPYHQGKGLVRHRMLATRAADNIAAVAFCNLVGGQDELVFDGHSAIFDERGDIVACGKQFEEDLIVTDLNLGSVFSRRLHDPRRRKEHVVPGRKPGSNSSSYRERPRLAKKRRCQSGMTRPWERSRRSIRRSSWRRRDYIHKNGFSQVVIAISGGIDSALTAAIAVDALGSENVVGVFMPSPLFFA